MPATIEEMRENPAAQTPMMRQFLSAKEAHPDAIVFFRMGDFYETFFDDAVVCGRQQPPGVGAVRQAAHLGEERARNARDVSWRESPRSSQWVGFG